MSDCATLSLGEFKLDGLKETYGGVFSVIFQDSEMFLCLFQGKNKAAKQGLEDLKLMLR
jgi:ABC-type siderophore export system fused ATPase/permease subunit